MSENALEGQQQLAIENKAAQESQTGVHSLDLGNNTVVKLDNLGPMIVNSDGTLSRISNWAELSDIERERTVRLLVKKRNLVRLSQQDKEQGGVADEDKLSALKAAQSS
ncbi:hypothetical protein Q8F55_005158 [Vanrija albida]|uniref:Uncharacterized protein n=1 Tax=Vanrija albida TaxID=181172 RepID=A0ABR3Q0V5_9TREE